MPFKKITSLTNPRIKNIVRLRNRRQRAESGLTIVEGQREVARALEAGVMFREVYICRELLERAKTCAVSTAGRNNSADIFIKKLSTFKIPVYETTDIVFSKVSYGDRAEGILGVCAPRALSFKDLPAKTYPLFVIVEGVEKPGNLGAILRNCDGAGVDGVIICDGKTDVYNPNVVRASLGTVFSVSVVASTNEAALEFLRTRDITVCAAMPRAKSVYTKTKLTGALAIVVGSEQEGLTGFWSRHCDLEVNIPMRGRADSLNVSASTAVLLYESIRQRSG